jgi:hypothetical protein
MFYRRLSPAFAVVVWLAATNSAPAAQQPKLSDEPNLTDEQKEEFLLKAQVGNSKEIGKGITHPWLLTLSDGTLTHDAAFVNINVSKPYWKGADERAEIGFRDTYHFNIAARKLAKLLGLGDMMPVTVERKWKGERGALSWWIPWKWDEEMRRKLRLPPPDADAWNNQIYRVRVFTELVYDTDRNLGNQLITEDWKLWMIDFTRAFRLYHTLKEVAGLTNCDRKLLEKLRQLDGKELLAKTKGQLSKGEVEAVMARRDKIVEHFQKLIAEKGENAVLY